MGVSGGGTGVFVGGGGVAVSDAGGVGVSGRGSGVFVGGTGVSVAGPGVTVGHGVSVGHGCAPTGIKGSDIITSKATVNKMAILRKRIASLSSTSRRRANKCKKWVKLYIPQTSQQ